MTARPAVISVLLLVPAVSGQPAAAADPTALVATLSTSTRQVVPGRPIWIDFTITNTSDEPVELAVPGTRTLPSAGVVGLPLAHVFSGEGFGALTIHGEQGQTWDLMYGYQPPAMAETVVLGPHASVGIGVDVTRYYPALRSPGRFRLRWHPYGGTLGSNELLLEVEAPKQAHLQTDQGVMTVRFFYDEAPRNVTNFLELARSGFYDNLTFHRIIPGYCIQGGCPSGDGTGIRPDGLRVPAELSDRPVARGAVCMARLENDVDSASCQFLICNTRVPEWDGRYTIIGELVGDESFATLDKLMATPITAAGLPGERLYTRAVRITDAPIAPGARAPLWTDEPLAP